MQAVTVSQVEIVDVRKRLSKKWLYGSCGVADINVEDSIQF